MPAAARYADQIGHTPPPSSPMTGALLGAALVLGGIAILGTSGVAAVAVAGALAAAGAGLAARMGGGAGGGGVVTGKIVGPCSGNVFTNGIPAARAHVDFTMCSMHPPVPLPIATGSANVFINGAPAARVSDKIACSAFILAGSGNVFIGGGAVQTDPIRPEGPIPPAIEHALLVAETGAVLALGMGEIFLGGLYNSAVRIGAGVASIPYLLHSVDAAVGVQRALADRLNYDL